MSHGGNAVDVIIAIFLLLFCESRISVEEEGLDVNTYRYAFLRRSSVYEIF